MSGLDVVYFVRREGLIKIGTTGNLTQRLNRLSRGGSMPDGMTVGRVELLAVAKGGRRQEQEWHRKFAATRIPRTEWFRPTAELHNLIKSLNRDYEGDAA